MKYRITIECEDISARIVDIIRRLTLGFDYLTVHDVLHQIQTEDKEITGRSINTFWKIERLEK